MVVSMSDFLKKFSNDSYQEIKKVDFSVEQQESKHEKDAKINSVDIEKTELTPLTLQPTQETTFQTSNAREEVFIRDDEKIKKRKRNILISAICAIVVIVIGIFGYYKLNEIKVPQFINEKTLNDVQVWATKNKINLNYTSIYSTEVDEGLIIKQSKKSGAVIQKGSSFEITLSKGADPEEHIEIPDFMTMTLTDIENWKQEQKVINAVIEKVFSDDVEKSKTISFEYKTEGIDADNYRRKDKINIIISKGKESYEKNIDMPDFKDKSKSEVESWSKENDINVEFIEEDSSKVIEGNVISQDIAAKTKVAKNDAVKITISRGKISYVPNFNDLDETQAQIESMKANVMINLVYYYSSSVPASRLINQSLPAGTEVKEQAVALMYSLGEPYIGNFDGEDVYTMIKSIQDMNAKGAQLTYELIEERNTEKKGSIITSNYKATFVKVGTHIVIRVSSGN